ncbi:C2 calcium/lipid-binding and GRAM domain containing protein [Perilla frutescens var. hirtella]|uniref:C2 calcium/lipid-binding and GRAM domain containing protein n=1 Tax=Perilla frutescens var. hirtella TaxID=608512 RepID=A0AAD4JFE7_PERFH|nr:C2 calcium/lipid-binding and GRAM domain containing protein [Perilla frutescens var. hirtella]
MGFKHILNMKVDKVPTQLAHWVLDNFDANSSEMRLMNGNSIPVDAEDVHLVFRFPKGGRKIERRRKSDVLYELAAKTDFAFLSIEEACSLKPDERIEAQYLIRITFIYETFPFSRLQFQALLDWPIEANEEYARKLLEVSEKLLKWLSLGLGLEEQGLKEGIGEIKENSTKMRLYVSLLEGRGSAVKNSYVKLQVGKQKSKTKILKNNENPLWNEEFVFRVHDLEEELVVSVYKCDDHDHGFFHVSSGEFSGRVKIPVWSVAEEENQNLPPTWFLLEKAKNVKSVENGCGKLLLSLSLHGRYQDTATATATENNTHLQWEGRVMSTHNGHASPPSHRKSHDGKHLMKALAGRLEKFFNNKEETPRDESSSELSMLSDNEDHVMESPDDSSFEESIELLQSRNANRLMPEDLQGGILIDQTYSVLPKDLNFVIFAPNSEFQRNLAELQGTTDFQEEPWRWKLEKDISSLRRVVTYTKAATKLVKAVKATEEQTYIKGDGNEFVVHVSVSTPDVPYGNTFKVELLYKIMSGDASSSEEESARLVVSWAVNFNQTTMMKGMIESGVRQGLKDSFEQFSTLLSQKFEVVKAADMSDKDHVLATLETEHQGDLDLAIHYFWNFTVVSTIFLLLHVLVHIFICKPSMLQGLEFEGLDLPDSFGELITSGILIIQLERIYYMISHFVEARLRRGSDHGVKAQGEGWVLTVALVEGANLALRSPTEVPDPYVVFTCNGKSRTSSVKLQTLDPQWNEILEFDAIEEPPSVLDVEVFNFEGPLDQSYSLGHAEINFLKHTASELADIWVPLDGKLAQSSQSKLHLRIFLDNNNGVETLRDYLASLEKEVGKKLSLRSPHRNSTFQKIFTLPPEEFLISDFSCSLKRKMPLQGRLFLSARIVGFYANLFGHKTRFFFLWEDIEDIQVLPPSLATVGSPTLVIILHKGRGLDSRHGAKLLDEQGRLHFYFHSFVSFNVASRTIMALWRTRTLEPDQKARIAEEQLQDDGKPLMFEDTGSYLVVEDVKMTKVYTVELPMNPKSLMEMFDGGDLEHKVMSKSGCLNYVTTTWEQVTPELQERRVNYKFSRHISNFGGEVTSTQQKSASPNDSGWVVNEVMTLHDVPLSDHFRVQLRYHIEKSSFTHNSCKCDVYIGIVWLRNTTFEARVAQNIIEKFTHRSEEILQWVEREALLTSK